MSWKGSALEVDVQINWAFLLDVLKGDDAAHAALAPDTVSFPGITYQAVGF